MAVHELRAEIPGTLALYHCESGAHVEAGEPIAEIECMKTFFTLNAPEAGVVAFVLDLGAVVGQDEVIATIST